ncbi:MAG: hypothetical protein WC969_14030 [Elusimicrobiota bacterium]|jgi:hypothetical protein
MEELIRKVGRVKVLIDNGMCRVGPRLDSASALDAALVRGAGRALLLSDAVVALCRAGRPHEALPLLRQLAAVAAAMRWIPLAQSDERARAVSSEWGCSRWDALWSDEALRERARTAGLAEDAEAVLSSCREFAVGGDSTLPWAHVFPENRRESLAPERVLELAGRLMGHVLRGLDARWQGDFPGA